ncbi:MAG: succinate dehydrogenase cytochrome b subunit [Candidatus Tectomicrobia bacterium]|uniref:Succinate dehydrogenase cytochrome b subunit n=1 Tax=Tectimicrobiota bacterium TaxID=2528274 RepID=A0A938B043_UNCTE|nr:succinate dehydrogenase cytochrome b subunit [Candidatus Tectomicrobia bacterium]
MTMVSILKKALMALTGLCWFVYLVLHLLGNFALWAGPESYNAYAQALISNPLLIPAEIVLVVTLLVHVCTAWRVTNENNSARPQRYVMKAASSGSSTLASRTMWYGGVILFIFLVLHVWMFKYGDQSGVHGLWGLVVRSFKNPLIALLYVVAMVPLGFHLSHGFASALQSLGAVQSHWRPCLRTGGQLLGWAIAAGFIVLPLWALFIAKV